MDSSPRPMRRFSRWKTTRHTFVLGGNAFITGDKDSKTNGQKDRLRRGDKEKPKIKSSRTSPHISFHKRQSLRSSLLEESSTEKQETNSSHQTVIEDRLQNGCEINNDCGAGAGSPSPQAFSILSPNVSATTSKLIQSMPSKHFNIEENSSSKLQSISLVQANQFPSTETSQDSNVKFVDKEKENSTSIVLVSRNTRSEVDKTSIPSNAKDIDESKIVKSSKRRSVRDKSFLSTSLERNSNEEENASVPLNLNVSTKKNDRESLEMCVVRLNRSSHKLIDKHEQKKDNSIINGNKGESIVQVEQNTFSPILESNMTSSDQSMQDISLSRSLTNNNKRKNKEYERKNTRKKMQLLKTTGRKQEKSKQCLNNETPAVQIRGDIEVLIKDTLPSSTSQFELILSNTNATSSHRSLRDRSHLVSPELQYPSKYISDSQKKNLSNQAKRLLSMREGDVCLTKKTKSCSSSGIRAVDSNDYQKDNVSEANSKKKAMKKLSPHKQNSSNICMSQDDTFLQASVTSASSHKLQKGIKKKKTHHNNTSSSLCKQRKDKKNGIFGNTGIINKSLPSEESPINNNLMQKDQSHPTTSSCRLDKRKNLEIESGVKKVSLQFSSSPAQSKKKLPKNDALFQNKYHKKDMLPKKVLSPCKDLHLPMKKKRMTCDISSGNQRSSTVSQSHAHIPPKKVDNSLNYMNHNDTHRTTATMNRTPHVSQNYTEVFDDTVVRSVKCRKRKLHFEEPPNHSTKAGLIGNIYENGRDLLLLSGIGKARKATSVTSLDIIFNEVLELEEHLRDSETDHLYQRLIGKVMRRMKESLKFKIYKMERIKELQSDVRKTRVICNKHMNDIAQHDSSLLRNETMKKKTDQKDLREWMENLKSLISSSWKQK